MTTSETHLSSPPSPGQASFSRWHRAGCCGSRFQRHVEKPSWGRKERPSLSPVPSQELRNSPQQGLRGRLTSRQPGLGHVLPLAPKSITAKGHLGTDRARPQSGGQGWVWGDHQWCLVRGHVRPQTSTCLPTARSSPTCLRNSFSSRAGRTRG